MQTGRVTWIHFRVLSNGRSFWPGRLSDDNKRTSNGETISTNIFSTSRKFSSLLQMFDQSLTSFIFPKGFVFPTMIYQTVTPITGAENRREKQISSSNSKEKRIFTLCEASKSSTRVDFHYNWSKTNVDDIACPASIELVRINLRPSVETKNKAKEKIAERFSRFSSYPSGRKFCSHSILQFFVDVLNSSMKIIKILNEN